MLPRPDKLTLVVCGHADCHTERVVVDMVLNEDHWQYPPTEFVAMTMQNFPPNGLFNVAYGVCQDCQQKACHE